MSLKPKLKTNDEPDKVSESKTEAPRSKQKAAPVGVGGVYEMRDGVRVLVEKGTEK